MTKPIILRILKRDNELHLFRRLEKCSIRLTKCEGAIEFVRLCQNFNLIPTFAKVDETKLPKWKKSSDLQKQVVNEELKSRQAQLKIIGEELRNIHDEIRLNCLTISPCRHNANVVNTAKESVSILNEGPCEGTDPLDRQEIGH